MIISYKNQKITKENCVSIKKNIELSEFEYLKLLETKVPIEMDEAKWEITNLNNWVYFTRAWSQIEMFKCYIYKNDLTFMISEIQLNSTYVSFKDFNLSSFKTNILNF